MGAVRYSGGEAAEALASWTGRQEGGRNTGGESLGARRTHRALGGAGGWRRTRRWAQRRARPPPARCTLHTAHTRKHGGRGAAPVPVRRPKDAMRGRRKGAVAAAAVPHCVNARRSRARLAQCRPLTSGATVMPAGVMGVVQPRIGDLAPCKSHRRW
eukprot:COSAG03_NODE_34_length_17821_cov_18.833531_20_plen_157_part_00